MKKTYPVNGPELKRLREDEAMLSQNELALKAGISPQHISLLEQGGHSAHGSTVKKLAAALGVTPKRLVQRDPLAAATVIAV